MVVGLIGVFLDANDTRPVSFGIWFAASALVHDFLLVPVVVLAGLALSRFMPARYRRYVQAGLIVSAIVTLFALPFVAGLGDTTGNPSALPANYGDGLLIILGAVWLVVGALALTRSRRR